MALLGELAVNLIARTTKFEGGIGKARKSLQGFEKSTKSAETSLGRLKSLMIGAIGTGGLILGVNKLTRAFLQSADSIDTLAKSATKLGIATEELQTLRHAAELTGVSTQTLDTSIQRMVRRIGQAAIGTGEAAKTLERLNLSAKALNELAPEKQFAAIGDAIQSLNKGEQLAAIVSIFDTEGAGLGQALAMGSKGLGQVREELEQWGTLLTSDEAKRVEEFKDAVTNLKAAAGGLGRGFVIDIAPAANEAVSLLSAILAETRAQVQSGGKRKGVVSTALDAAGKAERFLSGAGRQAFKGLNAPFRRGMNNLGLTRIPTPIEAAQTLSQIVLPRQQLGADMQELLRQYPVGMSAPAVNASELITQVPRNFVGANAFGSSRPNFNVPSISPQQTFFGSTMQTAGRTSLQGVPQVLEDQLKEQKDQKKREEVQTELQRRSVTALERMEAELARRGEDVTRIGGG